jgi:hypothetical protein
MFAPDDIWTVAEEGFWHLDGSCWMDRDSYISISRPLPFTTALEIRVRRVGHPLDLRRSGGLSCSFNYQGCADWCVGSSPSQGIARRVSSRNPQAYPDSNPVRLAFPVGPRRQSSLKECL